MPDLTLWEELETAAEIILAAAAQAHDGPWIAVQDAVCYESGSCIAAVYEGANDATWMALNDPAMGPLFAAVLKDAAQRWKSEVRFQADGWYHRACDGVSGPGTDEDCTCFASVLGLARHIRAKWAKVSGRG
ncbi:hypothetical protein [Nonomuraea wenchangensis]|uniref:Uncharacterized protein n=1 Tax=Nonomuraea wenchangensis TaxID=568860 RepID=A0A1I0LWR4_9ACTN|nr:hypothetical protein [Nonomuraea wenchangensis]SEU46856.1 hypothetical protein SAMN05421811_127162 [Nonomuraea wenchangensis]